MSLTRLDYVEAGDPQGRKSIIWLHGLGADGYDFEPIVPELRLDNLDIHYVFPHAPVRAVTVNAGAQMRAWYDIYALHADAPEDEAGIKGSEQLIRELINQEIARGVRPADIVLAGFSQGGVMALYTGLRFAEKLGGILALSCYLPLVSQLMESNGETLAERDLPMMLAHGTYDPVVPYSMGEDCLYYLQQLGYAPSWHSYPMQHSVCPEEIDDISAWLKGVFIR